MLAPAAAALDARLGRAEDGAGVFVALTNPATSDALDVEVLVHAGDRAGKGSAGRVVAGGAHVVWVGLGDLAAGDGAPMGPATGSPRHWNPLGLGAEPPAGLATGLTPGASRPTGVWGRRSSVGDGAPMGPAPGSPRRWNPIPAAARIDWRSAGTTAEAPLLSKVVTAVLGGGQPALRIEVRPLVVESTATLRVRVSSLDGRARQVALDALAPAGLLLLPPPAPIAVPASGAAVAEFTVVRGSAARGAVLEVALLARGPEAAGLASVQIELATELGLLRHLRPAMAAAALALFAAAALWRRRASSA